MFKEGDRVIRKQSIIDEYCNEEGERRKYWSVKGTIVGKSRPDADFPDLIDVRWDDTTHKVNLINRDFIEVAKDTE